MSASLCVIAGVILTGEDHSRRKQPWYWPGKATVHGNNRDTDRGRPQYTETTVILTEEGHSTRKQPWHWQRKATVHGNNRDTDRGRSQYMETTVILTGVGHSTRKQPWYWQWKATVHGNNCDTDRGRPQYTETTVILTEEGHRTRKQPWYWDRKATVHGNNRDTETGRPQYTETTVILTEEGHSRPTYRNPCPSATLSTVNPTWTSPGQKPSLRFERPARRAICRQQWLYLHPTPYWSLSVSSIKSMDSEHDITGLLSRHGACTLQRIVRVLGPQVPAFEHARQRRSLRDPAWDKNSRMNWIVKKFQYFLGCGTHIPLLTILPPPPPTLVLSFSM
jgi:hypothetical protein